MSRNTAHKPINIRVRDYVVLGRAAHLGVLDKPSEADFALVDEALKKLGISHFADRIYMQMSGGEKQLVNLARILVQQPQLIFVLMNPLRH